MNIEQILNTSELHRIVVNFFHQHPAAIDTVSGISAWVRGDKKAIKKILKELSKGGILDAHHVSSTIAYSYTKDPDLISQIKKVLS